MIDLRLWDRKPTKPHRRWWKIQAIVQQSVCFFSFVAVVTAIVILTLDAIGTQRKYKTYIIANTPPRAVLAAFAYLGVIADATLGVIVARLTWWPVHRAARSSLTISSILLIAVGTILVSVNRLPLVDCNTRLARMPTSSFSLNQHAGALISAIGILGLAICSAVKEGNRINFVLTRFIYFYLVIACITGLLCIPIVIISIILLHSNIVKPFAQLDTVISDPILAATALFLLIINIIAANYLQEPPASHLSVEEFDLAALTPAQRDAFAARISQYGKQVPGAPSGDAAIALMQGYTRASFPKTTCTVLRVFRPPTSVQKLMRRSPFSPTAASYEDDRAWQVLDEEKMVLRQTVILSDLESISSAIAAAPPKLSRYQQKKLARKQGKANTSDANQTATTATSSQSSLEPNPTPTTATQDLAFTAKLESTEALVLLTAIDDFDLTGEVKGWPGRLLHYTLGHKSFFKPLCVRFGLLAFHWPFRETTFYCSPARRPVARSAAVLRAVAEWNQKLPPARRCAVLLDPTYQHEATERAIAPSGWQPMPLPASHILDLRAHRGQTLPAYLRAIKYRDQEAAFRRAGGIVVETGTGPFTPAECENAMRLWRQIAEKRTKEGNTGVLMMPDEGFLTQLGAGGGGCCSLLFLEVEGQPVASCVLFRLGDTLTSDLQGLDYERARPLKAYFVMMQHVIAIALREGYSFVDFGPTTAKPKLDIGCKSVPLIGAMHAVSPLISFAMRIQASRTKSESHEQ
jgi:hypothetical protein